MLSFKRQPLSLVLFLLVGLGYFSVMSNLEINYFFKCLIAFLPIQVGALIYMSHPRWSRR